MISATRWQEADCDSASAFAVIQRIGGRNGYYYGNWLYHARCIIDRMIGGPSRYGLENPDHLAVRTVVDWWRVERIEPNHLLRLAAIMKLPGEGWLEFGIEDRPGGVILRLTAIFEPEGVFGLPYWYGLLPIHGVVWSGMLRGIARAAEARMAAIASVPPVPSVTS